MAMSAKRNTEISDIRITSLDAIIFFLLASNQ